jgi:hypothetical protein
MSIQHQIPRQDRRGKGRAPVMKAADCPHTVGTKTILDKDNGDPFGDDGSGSAPGANGPPTTGD